jgi:hypothetical protein
MFISILLNSILVIVFKVFMILPQIATSGKKDSYINQVFFNNSTKNTWYDTCVGFCGGKINFNNHFHMTFAECTGLSSDVNHREIPAIN